MGFWISGGHDLYKGQSYKWEFLPAGSSSVTMICPVQGAEVPDNKEMMIK